MSGTDGEQVYEANLLLNRNEYRQQRLYLQSWPRCLGLVLGNACNLDCPHCYQAKNGDNLLKPAEIGRELRRELTGFYPYLSTLRIQGGETFAFAGFEDLVEDVRTVVSRPIVSVSTNGTLIDERWAERIVATPFRTVTISVDGGTSETYARLRRGGNLEDVLENTRRIQRWKTKLASDLPHVDSFFVVMRSNFRELPLYFDLMSGCGVSEMTLQTMEINALNTSREPTLVEDEAIATRAEACELHALLRDTLPAARRHFRAVRTCGLTALFEQHGLDGSFLLEESQGLYPDSDGLLRESREPEGLPLCPNPWTTLFVAENGDAHLCFLSAPEGNLYEAPLASIWNSRRALAKRSDMIAGRYLSARCSERWCSWREGRKATAPPSDEMRALQLELKELAGRATRERSPPEEPAPAIAAARRTLASREQRIEELEVQFAQLCEKNELLHQKGRDHIAHLEAKCDQALRDFEQLENEYKRFRGPLLVRVAGRISQALSRLRRWVWSVRPQG